MHIIIKYLQTFNHCIPQTYKCFFNISLLKISFTKIFINSKVLLPQRTALLEYLNNEIIKVGVTMGVTNMVSNNNIREI